ncbi:kelch-like protein 12 [Actinia tenebrosa]|uniref:Kelch-like protein 12 n=1 Tax=Actinia tenebrosa TaxID=6105 RepID=A0A6P8IXQ6_ACTTE|nr:kelch-like protein 12 [Actinia tenebrosa]
MASGPAEHYYPRGTTFSEENHDRFIFKRLGQMRYHSVLTDVILNVEGRQFPAHKNVLAASSDYFMAMFSGHMAIASNTVDVHEISAGAMELLLDYVYTGFLEINEDNVEDIFCGSCLLLLDSVTQACCRFIQERLTLDNCWGIRTLADKFDCRDMLNNVNKFIEESFTKIVEADEYLLLPRQEIAKLLDDDAIVVPNEEVVFEALMKWMNHDLENRKADFPYLLQKVRLPQVKPEYFETFIARNELVKEIPEANEIIADAREKFYSFEDTQEIVCNSDSTFNEAAKKQRVNWESPRRCLRFLEVVVTVGGGALCEFFDADYNAWVPITPPLTRHCPGLETLDNHIYIVGGSKEWKRSDRCERYDPELNEWVVLSPMKITRSNIGLVNLNGYLYAIGGYDGRSPVRVVECYNPKKDEWTYVKEMNNCRDGACVVSDGMYIYAISGYDGNNYLSSVEVYDPISDKWTVGEVDPIVERREDAMAAVVDGKIYVIGGEHHNTFLASVEELDLDTMKWDFKTPMSGSRYQAGVAVLNKTIYICGGWTGEGLASSSVVCYDITTDSWSEVASLPAPSAARTTSCRFPRTQIERLRKSKNRKSGNGSDANNANNDLGIKLT